MGEMMAHIGYADRKAILDKALDITTVTEKKIVLTTETKDASTAEFTDYLIDTIKGLEG
jgi:isocitrate dehydrogenase (NAD+)